MTETDAGTILIVDDDHDSLMLLASTLTKEGYLTRTADSGELALASIAVDPPELILLDIRMPGIDGFEVYRRLQEDRATKEIPVIYLSAATEAEQRVEGLSLGAVDYVCKPFRRDELMARIRNHMELGRLRAGLKRQASDLSIVNELLQVEIAARKGLQDTLLSVHEGQEQRATRDELTGLPNRRSFMGSLSQHVARAHQGSPSALLVIGFDGLREVNRARGCVFGDDVVSAVAGAIVIEVGEGDIVARTSGAEFSALLEDVDAASALEIAGRIAQRVLALADSMGAPIVVGAGSVLLEPGSDVESALSAADIAMCADKVSRR